MRASLTRFATVALVLAGCGGDSFSANPATSPGGGGNGGAGGAVVETGGTSGGSGGGAAAGGAPANGGTTGGTGGAGTGGVMSSSDAGPTHWCAGRTALFCADFDEFTAIDTLLNSFTTYSTVGADFSLDNGAGVPSPPNALRVRSTADKDARGIVSQKIAPFASPPDHLRLEFSLRIDAGQNVGFLSGAAIVALFTGNTLTDGALALEIGNGPTLVAGYIEPSSAGVGFNTSNVPGLFPKPNQWSGRYALDVTYGKSPDVDGGRTGCLQILLGGVPQLSQCLKLPPTLIDPAFVSVALGVYSGGLGATGDVQIRLDNVILTAE